MFNVKKNSKFKNGKAHNRNVGFQNAVDRVMSDKPKPKEKEVREIIVAKDDVIDNGSKSWKSLPMREDSEKLDDLYDKMKLTREEYDIAHLYFDVLKRQHDSCLWYDELFRIAAEEDDKQVFKKIYIAIMRELGKCSIISDKAINDMRCVVMYLRNKKAKTA